MALSRKCVFLVFLCLIVLSIIPRSTNAKPLLIGTCVQFPIEKCIKTCIESNFAGGKCVRIGGDVHDVVCVCIPKYF
ncbi:hypothetical protein CARUB_v10011295mg [Capsella rubella]|uniref:Knottin scorpion toxin-like domain-containing protein n=1 Tax=Capsella rubella TaxID=81985 RepID=R0IK79_9BRAS|nr:defensin-like protein 32 [Capsella rubella]EOA38905.1 hypothetical protein CARUB_v10011295mg [Capsella rubella]